MSVCKWLNAIYIGREVQKKDEQEGKEQRSKFAPISTTQEIAMLFSILKKEHLQCYTLVTWSKFS